MAGREKRKWEAFHLTSKLELEQPLEFSPGRLKEWTGVRQEVFFHVGPSLGPQFSATLWSAVWLGIGQALGAETQRRALAPPHPPALGEWAHGVAMMNGLLAG